METPGIFRRGSGRNSTNAERQRQSYNLVVCSSMNHEDGYMFSDFMGYCMALREHGIGGDFFSCFPIERHFVHLRNDSSPPIDAIKFGKLGPNGDKALYTYSRQTYLNRQYWWTQVAPHELLVRVLGWIEDKQRKAEPGDVVNIILEGRGNGNGEYCIGDREIHPHVFRDLLSGFKDGVQANAISGACYSGQFIDAIRMSGQSQRYSAVAAGPHEQANSATRSISNRVRNSRFSQAVVQSLAKVNLPGVPRRRVIWRVQDHENFMKNQLLRNLTPNGTVVEPRFYSSEPVDGMTAVEELTFREKKDVVYDPRVSARRRRIEWPTIDEEVRRHLIMEEEEFNPSPPAEYVPESAKAVIDSEYAKCNVREGFKPDLSIYEQVFIVRPQFKRVLENLYWRGRRQSAVWDVFELLVQRGFIYPICLTIPVDLKQAGSQDAEIITQLLCCFTYIVQDRRLANRNKIPLQPCEWCDDVEWYAS